MFWFRPWTRRSKHSRFWYKIWYQQLATTYQQLGIKVVTEELSLTCCVRVCLQRSSKIWQLLLYEPKDYNMTLPKHHQSIFHKYIWPFLHGHNISCLMYSKCSSPYQRVWVHCWLFSENIEERGLNAPGRSLFTFFCQHHFYKYVWGGHQNKKTIK